MKESCCISVNTCFGNESLVGVLLMMSAHASKHELIPLIQRHLKEHGFLSAAEELQKQSPQKEASTSITLLDIYRSWLKSSKRKSKSAASKSSSEIKQATPKKVAQGEKTDKTTKQRKKLDKKSTPPKRKKGDVKATENIVKSNKSPKKEVPVLDGGEDSDSDSSLDVEKWKKLAQHMTDTDIAKINEFNALTQPKRQRVRKPRAKPNAKSETQQSNGQGQESEKPENSTEDVSANVNKTNKSRQKKNIWIKKDKEQNINVIAPVTPDISPKQDPKREKRKAESPADPPVLEPKKKKKKEAPKKKVNDTEGDKNVDNKQAKIEANPTTENLMEQSKVKVTDTESDPKKKEASKKKVGKNGGLVEKNICNNEEKIEAKNDNPTEGKLTDQSTVKTLIVESKPKKKKALKENVIESEDIVDRNALVVINTEDDNRVEDDDGNTIVESLTQNGKIKNKEDESIVKVKKGKKRKKDKTQDDGESRELVTEADAKTDTNISEETNEKTIEENDQNIAEMVPKKKKKKKGEKKEEPETLKVTDEPVASVEDVSEQASVKKKSKKKKKEAQDDLVSERTEEEYVQDSENVTTPKKTKESNDGNDTSVTTSERKKKKETKLSTSINTQQVPASTPQTPSSPTKKKKKSAEITQAQGDAASDLIESETPKKKKKKIIQDQ